MAEEQLRYSDLCRLCAAKTSLVMAIHIFESEGEMRQIGKKIEACLPVQVRVEVMFVWLVNKEPHYRYTRVTSCLR